MKFRKYITEEELLIEEGRFEYASQVDAENHRTLQGLVKNNGIFKSMKQRWYLLNKKWAYWKVSTIPPTVLFLAPPSRLSRKDAAGWFTGCVC